MDMAFSIVSCTETLRRNLEGVVVVVPSLVAGVGGMLDRFEGGVRSGGSREPESSAFAELEGSSPEVDEETVVASTIVSCAAQQIIQGV